MVCLSQNMEKVAAWKSLKHAGIPNRKKIKTQVLAIAAVYIFLKLFFRINSESVWSHDRQVFYSVEF